MGMGIGINENPKDAGKIRGRQEAVACYVWFTSRGEVMPKMLKFADENGEIHTLQHIHVICREQKNYCGIPTLEYRCDTVVSGHKYEFWLLYYIERQEWKILWQNQKTRH